MRRLVDASIVCQVLIRQWPGNKARTGRSNARLSKRVDQPSPARVQMERGKVIAMNIAKNQRFCADISENALCKLTVTQVRLLNGLRLAGSKTELFEMIGTRPGDHPAEFLFITDDLRFLRDLLVDSDDCLDHCDGFDAFEIICPGESRPCDVVMTEHTVKRFIGKANVEEFVSQWVKDFDNETMDSKTYRQLYGERKSENHELSVALSAAVAS